MISDIVLAGDISTKGPSVGQFISTYSTTFTVPSDVTSISVLCVGMGGRGSAPTITDPNTAGGITNGGGGGGGGLSYVNGIAVIGGESLTITVTAVKSSLMRGGTVLCEATAGTSAAGSINGVGGSAVVGTGYSGSAGIFRTYGSTGGAAAGYAGNAPTGTSNGIGGSGATGYSGQSETWISGIAQNITYYEGQGGGGVGIFGIGANGVFPSGGGSGGNAGDTTFDTIGNSGGNFGGGGGSGAYAADYDSAGKFIRYTYTYSGGLGGNGVVRIVYPGTTRQFPSTNVGNY